jgi:hypothetical protein
MVGQVVPGQVRSQVEVPAHVAEHVPPEQVYSIVGVVQPEQV